MFSKMKLFTILYFIFSVVFGESRAGLNQKQESDITRYLTKQIDSCVVSDVTTLNICIKDLTIQLKPYFPYGIKSWKVPALEPMSIMSINIAQNNAGTALKATFKDLLVSGLSDFAVSRVNSHPEEYRFVLGLQFPRLAIKGHYDIDGIVLVLTLKDKGPFTANLTRVQATADMKFKVEGGKLRLYEVVSDFNFQSMRFHLDDLLKGTALGETVNDSLNASVDDLLKDFKPAFVSEINRIVLQAFQEALLHIPLARWRNAFSKH